MTSSGPETPLARARALMAATPAIAVGLATLAMLAVGEWAAPGFASPTQMGRQLAVAAILAVVAAGQGLVILSGREGIDLSVGSVMSLTALVAGNVMDGRDAMTVPALLAAMGAGGAIGCLNGVGVAWLRIPPLVMTLGMAGVVTGLLVVLTQGQNSGAASDVLQGFVARPLALGLPGILWAWLLLIGALHLALTATRAGINLYAVGANDTAAALSGVRVRITRAGAYGAAGALAGLGGFLLLGYTGTVFVGAGEQYVLPSVIAAVIGGTSLAGGRGGTSGTALGAVFLTVLTAFLTTMDMEPAARQALFGLVLIAFMVLYGREAPHR